MVAYIFRANNTVTRKTYIGKNYSVRFDKRYLGDNPGVLDDVKKYGADKFIINMIRACETVKDCDMAYASILKEYNAENDENYYNFVVKVEEPEKPKKTRKKKVVEE